MCIRDSSYTNRVIALFVPNFVAITTGLHRGKMQLAAFDGPSSKTPYMRKNLANITYASRAIAYFVPNFVAIATGVSRGKMQLAEFDGPSPKTFYRRNNLPKISYVSRVIAHFVSISLPWQLGSVGEKRNWEHSMAHSRNPSIGAKVSQKSLTQAEL